MIIVVIVVVTVSIAVHVLAIVIATAQDVCELQARSSFFRYLFCFSLCLSPV